jgi:RHS repeat-associated protein
MRRRWLLSRTLILAILTTSNFHIGLTLKLSPVISPHAAMLFILLREIKVHIMPKSKDPKDTQKRDIAALLNKANELYPPTQPNGYQFESAKAVKDKRLQTLPTRKPSKQKSEAAAATVQGPPSIVELSRALDVDGNGPQFMFEWVYNNIEWEPGWGVYKGDLGCLMDGRGNAFDQCLLFASLLRQASYTAHIIQGAIRLEEADYQAWWNVADIWSAQSYCGNEFIPIVTTPTWTGSTYYMDIKHVWVAWVDGGTTYYFDPSYKQYTRTNPLSSVTLAAALDYNSTTYLSDAESGATIDGGGDFVQKMNRGNIRDNLSTYTTNLIDYINSNTIGSAPPGTATVDDILGGQSIIPAEIPILQTSLPYEMPDDDPNIWTGDVPETYIPTLQIQMVNQDDPGIIDFDYTAKSTELAATRLTLWYEDDIPSLYLNGDVVATGVEQDPFGWATWIVITVTHPAYDASEFPTFWQQFYQTTWQWNQGPIIPGGPSYLVANAWGNSGSGQMRYHQKQLAANKAAGGSSTDENILGEKLAIASWNWIAQNTRVCELENKLRVCHTMYNHQVGLLSFNLWGDGAIAIDLGGVSASSTNFNNDVTQTPPNDRVLAMHGVALEAGVCAQMTGLTPGISTTTVVDEASRTIRATIGGTATAGDVLTLTAHDSSLGGGQESVIYTVGSGNTLSDVADGLAAAINTNTNLSSAGITATSTGAQVALYTQSGQETSYSSSTSGGATETISLSYDKIYRGTSTNWNTGTNVESILVGNGYDSGQMSDLYNFWIQWGNIAVLGDHPDQVLGAWTGWGDWVYPPAGAYGFILGGIKGGGGQPGDINDGPPDSNPGNDPGGQDQTADPIGWFTGDYTYIRTDMTVGSGKSPYLLSFRRTYNSAKQYSNGPLGRGWNHNWQMSAITGSDGLLAMGSLSGLQAASTIANFFVNDDLASDTTFSASKLVTMCLADKWWIDQIVNNTVVVTTPENTRVFLRQPDGSYSLPVHNSNKLIAVGGLYTLTDKRQVVHNFNSDGNVETIEYPTGVVVTLTYLTGKLQTISNGMARTLTLGYTGDKITSVADGNGRSVAYDFDVDSNLEKFRDAESKETTYVFDQPGRMTQFFRPANPTTPSVTNVYDSLNRVQSQSNARSQTWTYFFAGSRSEEIDPLGNSHVRYLNQFGSITRDINALGFETNHEYDGVNRRILTTLPEGNQTQWEYDSSDNVITKTLIPKIGSGLSNIVLEWTFDSTYNKPLTFVDGNLNTWTWNYDAGTGDLLTFEKPTVGGKIPKQQRLYNARGQVVSFIDETGMQTQLAYDNITEVLASKIQNTNWQVTVSGTVTSTDILTITAHDTSLPGGSKAVSYTVTGGDTLALIAAGLANAINADSDFASVGIVAYSTGAIISISTAVGNTTSFTCSTSGGATEILSPNSGLELSSVFGYNSWGDLISVTDANSNETTFLFDNERRLTQRTEPTPFSFLTNIGYDDNGNLTSIQRQKDATPTWVTTSISYTVSDKKYQLTDPMSYVSQWDYDGKDRLQTFTDAESRDWNYVYDELDRLSTVTDPTNTVSESRTYTDNGCLYELTDASSNSTIYSYDGFDRLDQTLYADSTFEQNQIYDDNNNVLVYLDRHGDSITNTYDSLNRLSTKAPTGQATVTFTYDLADKRTGVSTPPVGGNPSSGSFIFSFDSAGRLLKETTPDSKEISYQLDAVGNMTRLTYPDGYYVTRIFDEMNRLTDVKLNGSGSAALHFDWDYLSRRQQLTYLNGAEVYYDYQDNDDMVRLEQIYNGSNSVEFTYGFNNVHEESSKSIDDGSYMWHPSSGGTTTYGTANNVNEYPTVGGVTQSYNDNGCLTSDGVWTFSYDMEDHLISASKSGVSVSYVYDGLHRQIQKTVGSTKTRFVYSGWQRIADYDGTGNTLQERFVYGPGLDDALISVSSGGTTKYLHADRMGTIIATTDGSGNLISQFSLSPLGEGTPSGTTFGFTAQRYDSETGLYYYKRRYYSPEIGRFLQPDPIRFATGELNLYTYVRNSPLTYIDPLGLQADANSPANADPELPSKPPQLPVKVDPVDLVTLWVSAAAGGLLAFAGLTILTGVLGLVLPWPALILGWLILWILFTAAVYTYIKYYMPRGNDMNVRVDDYYSEDTGERVYTGGASAPVVEFWDRPIIVA